MALWFNRVNVKDVYSSFTYDNKLNNNKLYVQNNWVKEIYGEAFYLAISNEINIINLRGGALWLTSNGDICYRFSPKGKVHTATLPKINILFSNFLNCNFTLTQKITKKQILADEREELHKNNNLVISVSQLLLAESEEYNPHENYEFYINKKDGLYYRNTFKPSHYLTMSTQVPETTRTESWEPEKTEEEYIRTAIDFQQNEPQKSIILQYLYHLSGYSYNKFSYILNWIASFFKNLENKSNTTLVLYGSKDSGLEILFHNIIVPLFGEENCLEITDKILTSNNVLNIVKEKLFYNLNNISKSAIENKVTKQYLQSLLSSQQKYAQTLITIEEPELLYLENDENYTVFHIATKLDQMYIPVWCNRQDKTKITKIDLENNIKKDLENFVKVLRFYSSTLNNQTPFENDNRNMMTVSLDDKLKIFINAVKNIDKEYFKQIQLKNNKLYAELEQDFEKKLIKQANLLNYFKILNPDSVIESSRTFMNMLRKIDNDFFKVENAKSLSAGKKYFHIFL
ncbi:hypothetical protein [Sulfurimonas sp.]|uniref:hypothetical protein n=1 Tax=Sulfurimonas sp. TaxID=2022749 RepID=UPI0025DFF514|nr:hypothetical protein [Sulfurimonas sp.]MDD5158110.1 hypothetical protein [Sulfurimonas sp.]